MPDHRTHRAICRLLLGRSYPDVDKFLDSTYPISGRKHRQDWVHSIYGAMLYAIMNDFDEERLLAGLIHLMADQMDQKALKLLLQFIKS